MSLNGAVRDAAAKTVIEPPTLELPVGDADSEAHPASAIAPMNAASVRRVMVLRLRPWQFHDHVGCFDDAHGADTGHKSELIHGFPSDEGAQAVGACLDLDLRRDPALGHARADDGTPIRR